MNQSLYQVHLIYFRLPLIYFEQAPDPSYSSFYKHKNPWAKDHRVWSTLIDLNSFHPWHIISGRDDRHRRILSWYWQEIFCIRTDSEIWCEYRFIFIQTLWFIYGLYYNIIDIDWSYRHPLGMDGLYNIILLRKISKL